MSLYKTSEPVYLLRADEMHVFVPAVWHSNLHVGQQFNKPNCRFSMAELLSYGAMLICLKQYFTTTLWNTTKKQLLSKPIATEFLVVVVVVAFSLLARSLGECSTINSPPALLLLVVLLKWRLARAPLIPLFFFLPESVHGGSASWEDWGRIFPDNFWYNTFSLAYVTKYSYPRNPFQYRSAGCDLRQSHTGWKYLMLVGWPVKRVHVLCVIFILVCSDTLSRKKHHYSVGRRAVWPVQTLGWFSRTLFFPPFRFSLCFFYFWNIVFEFIFSPDIIPRGWLGSKHQLTKF